MRDVGREITGWLFPQYGGFDLGNAIPPFAGDEIAVLLLEYKLTHVGEAEVEVDWAAVTGNIWSPHRAFFVSWRETGLLTYTSRSNSIPNGETKQRKVKEIY